MLLSLKSKHNDKATTLGSAKLRRRSADNVIRAVLHAKLVHRLKLKYCANHKVYGMPTRATINMRRGPVKRRQSRRLQAAKQSTKNQKAMWDETAQSPTQLIFIPY